MLRPYQQKAIDDTYQWFASHATGNPCIVLPTGSGKSHIVAALCKDAVQNWPQTRIVMLTHRQELIEQNAEKMRQHWPNVPLGIYSAALSKYEIDQITFAGVQSVAKRAEQIGHVDLAIVDECHLINHRQEGSYRMLLSMLESINPSIRVIGLSATPWRLGHGFIHTGEGTLFDGLVEPVTIKQLIDQGYLAPLRSKFTDSKIDTTGVKKRGGEYVTKDLEAAVDTEDNIQAIVTETLRRADYCQSVIVFCPGVENAEHMADAFNAAGWPADTLNGGTRKYERARIINDFKAKRIRVLTNVDVLTTGFDAPDIDCIVMARPTMSPVLYVQMAGRGMRIKTHTDHCLVLDFAGNVAEHGPITSVRPPKKKGDGQGEAPVKPCPECGEAVHASVKLCPDCGYEFPEESRKKSIKLHNDDIMGLQPTEMEVTDWQWRVHKSHRSGLDTFRVTYYSGLTKGIDEYFAVNHPKAGPRAMRDISKIVDSVGAELYPGQAMEDLCDTMNRCAPPATVEYHKSGKFYNIINRSWNNATADA